jgi:murein DD-endopeptidase MepM/ murein hydrolase activator NlpD
MYAVESGTVAQVKANPDGYGAHIRLLSRANDDGILHEWTYGHMSYIAVKEGQKVEEGQYIGNIGNTGFVVSGETANGFWKANPYAGTHLHLGMRIMKHDRAGWKYEGYNRAITCMGYGNGFKGAVDPVRYLRDQSLLSTKIETKAREKGWSIYMKASLALRQAGR